VFPNLDLFIMAIVRVVARGMKLEFYPINLGSTPVQGKTRKNNQKAT